MTDQKWCFVCERHFTEYKKKKLKNVGFFRIDHDNRAGTIGCDVDNCRDTAVAEMYYDM